MERARGSIGTSRGEGQTGAGAAATARGVAWRGGPAPRRSHRRPAAAAAACAGPAVPHAQAHRVYTIEKQCAGPTVREAKAWCAHLPGHVRQAAAAAHVVLAAARTAGSRACRRAAALRRHLGRGCARLNVVLRARPMASVPTHGAPKRPGSVPRFGAWLARGESDAQRVSRRGLGPGTTSPQPPKVPPGTHLARPPTQVFICAGVTGVRSCCLARRAAANSVAATV